MFGVLGLPVAVPPVGRTADGLPVGVQVVTPYLRDRDAVRTRRADRRRRRRLRRCRPAADARSAAVRGRCRGRRRRRRRLRRGLAGGRRRRRLQRVERLVDERRRLGRPSPGTRRGRPSSSAACGLLQQLVGARQHLLRRRWPAARRRSPRSSGGAPVAGPDAIAEVALEAVEQAGRAPHRASADRHVVVVGDDDEAELGDAGPRRAVAVLGDTA